MRARAHREVPAGGRLSPGGVDPAQPRHAPRRTAQIYLTPLDRELERRRLAFCRYADVNSERSAKRVLASVVRWVERNLKLPVNRAKSGTGRPWERQMLGFRLLEDGTIAIAPKSLERYRQEVRRLWDGRQSLTSKELVRQWQRFMVGWWNRRAPGAVPPRWLGAPAYAQVLLAALARPQGSAQRTATSRRPPSSPQGGEQSGRRLAYGAFTHPAVGPGQPRAPSLRAAGSIGSRRRLMAARSNRRMRKTACPVVWEG
jgi:hypothetical protein